MVVTIAISCRLADVVIPSAYALGLLPLLVPDGAQWTYALQVGVGAAAMVVVVMVWAHVARAERDPGPTGDERRRRRPAARRGR